MKASDAKRKAESVQREIASIEKAKKDQHLEYRRLQGKYMSEESVDALLNKHIPKAAFSGKCHLDWTIYAMASYHDEVFASAYYEIVSKALTREGYKTNLVFSEDKPCGSDPMFDETMYNAHIHIMW